MARQVISPEQWAVARALWENEPLCNFAEIAENYGITRQAVQLQAKRKGWIKRLDQQTVSDLAHAAADSKLTESPVGASGQEDLLVGGSVRKRIERAMPEMPLGASEQQLASVAQKAAIEGRAELLGTHRKELLAARNVLYQAIKGTGDNELAKKAKIIAEGMKIIQEAERRAWNLDADEKGKPSGVQVIVNRRPGKISGR